MPIIDSQIHPYEANTAKRPWVSTPNWPPSASADENIAAMDKLGIDGAILISSFSMYRYDASYAVEAYKAHPDRFALVKPLDVDDPAIADVIAEWKKTPGTVGVRIQITPEPGRDRDPNHPGFERIARAAARHDFPVNMLCWGRIDAGASIIDSQIHPYEANSPSGRGIARPRTGRPAQMLTRTLRRWTSSASTARF